MTTKIEIFDVSEQKPYSFHASFEAATIAAIALTRQSGHKKVVINYADPYNIGVGPSTEQTCFTLRHASANPVGRPTTRHRGYTSATPEQQAFAVSEAKKKVQTVLERLEGETVWEAEQRIKAAEVQATKRKPR